MVYAFTIMEVLNIAKNYLRQKYSCSYIKITCRDDIICDGQYYSPRRVRNSTIWLSEKRLKFLKHKNAIVLAVDTSGGIKITEIPASRIVCDTVIDGIRVKVKDKVRVEISRDLKNYLEYLAGSVEAGILKLLDAYDRALRIPVPGLSGMASAFRGCLIIAKYNLPHIELMKKLMNNELKLSDLSEKEVRMARELASNRIAFIDNRHDGEYVKLICTYELVEKPDNISFVMKYSHDFCRLYCSNYSKCKYATNSNKYWFGIVANFTPEEFRRKTPEELVGKWVGLCMEELEL